MTVIEVKHDRAVKFLSDLHTTVPNFLVDVATTLQTACNIDVSDLQADHVCWRTETDFEYNDLVKALLADPDHFSLLIESEIGGRPIATFQIATPILSAKHQIGVVEIPSPKEGSPYKRGLEHVEFVIGCGTITSPWNDDTHQCHLVEFQKKYPNVTWNTKAMNKQVNPDISVKLKTSHYGICSAKFHLMPLCDVIAAEKLAESRTSL